MFSRGSGPNVNFDHHRGAAYENLFSDIRIGEAWRGRRVWECSGTPTGHYTAARETFWNLQPKVKARWLPAWPAVNVIGVIRGTESSPAEAVDGWAESVRGLRPPDLHAAQLARRLGRPLPEALPLPEPRSGHAAAPERAPGAGTP